MSRTALAFAVLIGMSSACSFAACPEGCVGELVATDASESIDVTCHVSNQLITPTLPFVTSCHTNVYYQTTTPGVCSLVAPTPDDNGFTFSPLDVSCLAAGTCTVYQHKDVLSGNCICN